MVIGKGTVDRHAGMGNSIMGRLGDYVSRHRNPILAGLALAVTGAGVGGYLYLERGSYNPPREPVPITRGAEPRPTGIPSVIFSTPEPTYTPAPTLEPPTPTLEATPTKEAPIVVVPTETSTPTPIIIQKPNTPTPEAPTPVSRETAIMQELHKNVPEIDACNKDEQHRRVPNAAVLQIRDDVYNNGLDRDSRAWEYISKAVGFVVPVLCGVDEKGNYKIDVSVYSENDLRQIIMPRELRSVDIKKVMARLGGTYNADEVGLNIGIKNVTDDSELGMSPQKWLAEKVMKDYNSKGTVDGTGYNNYIRALNSVSVGAPAWVDNYNSFEKVVEEMKRRGEDVPLFINGYSIFKVGEQSADQFGVLVTRLFDPPLAGYSIRAKYPNKTGTNYPDEKIGTHTELGIKTGEKLFHIWMDRSAFFRAYEGALNKPNIVLYGPDGKTYDPYEFN